jgi:hypothetical protein
VALAAARADGHEFGKDGTPTDLGWGIEDGIVFSGNIEIGFHPTVSLSWPEVLEVFVVAGKAGIDSLHSLASFFPLFLFFDFTAGLLPINPEFDVHDENIGSLNNNWMNVFYSLLPLSVILG